MTTLTERLGYHTREEVAQLLGIDLGTEANRRSAGQMPAHTKVGRNILYSADAVREWLASREQRRARGPGRPRRYSNTSVQT